MRTCDFKAAADDAQTIPVAAVAASAWQAVAWTGGDRDGLWRWPWGEAVVVRGIVEIVVAAKVLGEVAVQEALLLARAHHLHMHALITTYTISGSPIEGMITRRFNEAGHRHDERYAEMLERGDRQEPTWALSGACHACEHLDTGTCHLPYTNLCFIANRHSLRELETVFYTVEIQSTRQHTETYTRCYQRYERECGTSTRYTHVTMRAQRYADTVTQRIIVGMT